MNLDVTQLQLQGSVRVSECCNFLLESALRSTGLDLRLFTLGLLDIRQRLARRGRLTYLPLVDFKPKRFGLLL